MTGRSAGHAVELLLPGADTDDRERWLEVRRRGITASEIGLILGYRPSADAPSPFALYQQKLGLADDTDNPRLRLGRYLEGYVCDVFADRHPEYHVLRLGLAASSERMWQMASCDRVAVPAGQLATHGGQLTLAQPVPVEAKTSSTYDGWGPDGSEVIPVHYFTQVMWQMDVLGAPAGYVACLFLLTQKVRVYEIPRDDDAIAVMREAAAEFRQRLEDRNPPATDELPATRRALAAMYQPDPGVADVALPRRLAVSYLAAVRAYSAAEQRKRKWENRVRAAMGAARYAVDGRTGEKIATRTVYKTTGYYREGGTVDRLTPARRKEQE